MGTVHVFGWFWHHYLFYLGGLLCVAIYGGGFFGFGVWFLIGVWVWGPCLGVYVWILGVGLRGFGMGLLGSWHIHAVVVGGLGFVVWEFSEIVGCLDWVFWNYAVSLVILLVFVCKKVDVGKVLSEIIEFLGWSGGGVVFVVIIVLVLLVVVVCLLWIREVCGCEGLELAFFHLVY